MSATGIAEAMRWDADFRQTFPELLPAFVEDDLPDQPLPGGGLAMFKFWGLLPDGRPWYKIRPDKIPGRASWWHERGHHIYRIATDRPGIVGTELIKQGFRVRGADPALVDANGFLTSEQWCSFLPEAFGCGWGGYPHPCPTVPIPTQQMQQFFRAVATNAPQPAPTGGVVKSIWLPSPNYEDGRPGAIRYLVLHTTQGTDSRSWLTSLASRVSAHYLVRGENVYQLVNEDDVAWHAGIIVGTPTTPIYQGSIREYINGLPWWDPNPNDESIGIEMEGFAADLLDSDTLDTTAALIRDIERRRGYLPLVSHSELSPGNRSDPGPQNRAAVEERLGDDMYTDADRARDEAMAAKVADIEKKQNAFTVNVPTTWLRRMFWGFDPQTKQKRDPTTPIPNDIP